MQVTPTITNQGPFNDRGACTAHTGANQIVCVGMASDLAGRANKQHSILAGQTRMHFFAVHQVHMLLSCCCLSVTDAHFTGAGKSFVTVKMVVAKRAAGRRVAFVAPTGA